MWMHIFDPISYIAVEMYFNLLREETSRDTLHPMDSSEYPALMRSSKSLYRDPNSRSLVSQEIKR